MAIIKKLSILGGNTKCIALTKDIKDLFELKDKVKLTIFDGKLLVEPYDENDSKEGE